VVIDPVWQANRDSHGRQPGDPAKAAAAVLSALDAQDPPLRLPLGNDAADAIGNRMADAHRDLLAWEHLSRSTDVGA
jgi:hypothetical protein